MSLKNAKRSDGSRAVAAVQRRDFALALGVGINVVVIWGLTSPAETPAMAPANDVAAIVFADPMALPQTVELAYGELQPPANDVAQSGTAKGAVWKYLCTRDPELRDATQASCPEFDMGSIGLGALTPPTPEEQEELEQKFANESAAGGAPQREQLR